MPDKALLNDNLEPFFGYKCILSTKILATCKNKEICTVRYQDHVCIRLSVRLVVKGAFLMKGESI